jgi:BspA type Leucine rich repeat region (6 copies)
LLDTVPFFHDLTFERCIFEVIIYQPIYAGAIVVLGKRDRTSESISMRRLFASATILAIMLTNFGISPASANACTPSITAGVVNGSNEGGCISLVISDGIATFINDEAFTDQTDLVELSIGEGVTRIGESAFTDATSLTTLTLPNSLTRIDDRAFSGATSLTNLVLPNSLTHIGEYAFADLTSLTSLSIPNSVTTVQDYAFRGATNLTSLTIGTGVSQIGMYAFLNATALTSVIIPNNITGIDIGTFMGASSLANVTIGSGVNTIQYRAFQNAELLTRVTFLGAAPAVTLESDDSNTAFFGISAGAKAIVTAANAASFGGVGNNWNGLRVEIATSDAPPTDDGAAEAARVAAIAEAARVAEAARQATAAAAAKQQRELTELLSIIPSIAGLALNLGETTKALTLQKCVKKKQIKYVKKGAKCPKGFAKKK